MRRMAERLLKKTTEMVWEPSPSPSVLRKRLELLGEKESGRVTSVVQYLENATFSEHPHPSGEEIFVISGVFSDQTGDHPAGAYCLNPEGFAHAPRSKDGCVLLVKLKQYPGKRNTVRVNSNDPSQWTRSETFPDVSICTLYKEPEFPETMELVQFTTPATIFDLPAEPNGLEIFMLEGAMSITQPEQEDITITKGTWFKMAQAPPTKLTNSNSDQTTLTRFYLKRNHLASPADDSKM